MKSNDRYVLLFLILNAFIQACSSSDVLDLTESQRLTASFQSKLVKEGFSIKEAADISAAGYKEAKDQKEFSQIMPLLVKGAVTNLASSGSSLYITDATDRLNSLTKIMNASFKAMNGEGPEMSLAEQKKLRGQIASTAMTTVKSANVVVKTNYNIALKKIMESSVSNLDDSGIAATEMQSAVGVVTAEIASGLKTAEFEAASMDELSNSMVSGGIESIKQATTDPAAYNSYAKDLIKNAIGNADEMGLTTSAALYDVLYDATNGAVSAAAKAELTAEQMDSMVTSIVSGAVEVFDDIGMTDENLYDDGLSSIVQGAIGALDNVYGTSLTTAEMKTKVSSVVSSAMTALSASFEIDEDNYTKAVKGVSTGAITGLLAAGYKDASKSADILEISKGITEAAIGALDDAGIPSYYIDSTGSIVNLRESTAKALVLGVTEGIEATKIVTDTEIKDFSDDLATAATDALSDGGVTVLDENTFKSEIDSSVDTEVDTDDTDDTDATLPTEDTTSGSDTIDETDASALIEIKKAAKKQPFVHAYYEDEIESKD